MSFDCCWDDRPSAIAHRITYCNGEENFAGNVEFEFRIACVDDIFADRVNPRGTEASAMIAGIPFCRICYPWAQWQKFFEDLATKVLGQIDCDCYWEENYDHLPVGEVHRITWRQPTITPADTNAWEYHAACGDWKYSYSYGGPTRTNFDSGKVALKRGAAFCPTCFPRR